MELWDPAARTVKTIIEQLPQENGATTGLFNYQLLSLNYHTELLFVGGAVNSIPIASIWKFSYPKFMWTKIGDLIYPNNQQTCFEVYGFSC